MQEIRTDSEFHLVVTGTRRDGRRRYDEESKWSLARACLQPGVSLAGMALKLGVNANLLRKWVVSHQLAPDVADAASLAAFVPVMLSSSGPMVQGGRVADAADSSHAIGDGAEQAAVALAGANAQRRFFRIRMRQR